MTETKRTKIERIIAISLLGIAGILAGYVGATHLESQKRKPEYNKIFLNESNKLPTKQDSINFYSKHGLEDYVLYENPLDTTKSFEEHIKLFDVPYSEIKRIVKENKVKD